MENWKLELAKQLKKLCLVDEKLVEMRNSRPNHKAVTDSFTVHGCSRPEFS